MLTFPPSHRRHRAAGTFSTIPVPSEGMGELGALKPPDPDEAPRARRLVSPIIPTHPEAGGKDVPKPAERQLRPGTTCRAGSEIGKTPGVAHTGPGVLPAGAVR